MRLARLRVECFRGISSLDMEFDELTAVIGENNHGKTSVFDILGLFLGRRDRNGPEVFRQDDFHLPADHGHGRAEARRLRRV